VRRVVTSACFFVFTIFLAFYLLTSLALNTNPRATKSVEVPSPMTTILVQSPIFSDVSRKDVQVDVSSKNTTIYAAFGRVLDIKGWLGDTKYLNVDTEHFNATPKPTDYVGEKEVKTRDDFEASDMWVKKSIKKEHVGFSIQAPNEDTWGLLVESNKNMPTSDLVVNVSYKDTTLESSVGTYRTFTIIFGIIALLVGLTVYTSFRSKKPVTHLIQVTRKENPLQKRLKKIKVAMQQKEVK
jgi:hypothetical protein